MATASESPSLPIGFDVERYRRCEEIYEKWSGAVDEALYALCQRHPRHDDHAGVAAKCWIIGRTYATGIERQIPSNGLQGGAVGKLVRSLVEHHEQVDGLVDELRGIEGPLTPEALQAVLRVHGRFLQLLRQTVRPGVTPRSFVSKYLHFHCPVVPIYDAVARDRLSQLVRWCNELIVVDKPVEADNEYGWFCYRLWHLHEQAHEIVGEPVSGKMLDYYLLCLADGSI